MTQSRCKSMTAPVPTALASLSLKNGPIERASLLVNNRSLDCFLVDPQLRVIASFALDMKSMDASSLQSVREMATPTFTSETSLRRIDGPNHQRARIEARRAWETNDDREAS